MKKLKNKSRIVRVCLWKLSKIRVVTIAIRIVTIAYVLAGSMCGLILLYALLLFTVFDTFRVPTNSMTPTIHPGDRGIINKLKLGARYFDIYAAAACEPFEIKRMPGYGKLERGDIIVFNASFMDNSDTIVMNMYRYYCKRAVAVAGDTLEIRRGYYHVRGINDILGVMEEQEKVRYNVDYYMKTKPDSVPVPDNIKIAPWDSVFGWTMAEMGPLVIPGKGMKLNLDYRNTVYYRKYIEWETGRKVEWRDSCAYMDGEEIPVYTFKEDYFFAAGDHASNSNDSRYWGLVPEKFIVGVATLFGHLPWE